MRVISGELGGLNFNSVPGHRTHPMSEKIRGALFNALGDINDLSVLDAFGGTGALGIEAVSRGASSAIIIELDKTAHRTIKENIDILGLTDKITTTRAAIRSWSRRHQNLKFDIVLIDPPYNAVEPKELLLISKHAKVGGIIILSLPPNNGFQYGESNQQLLMKKTYGDAELSFYRQL